MRNMIALILYIDLLSQLSLFFFVTKLPLA